MNRARKNAALSPAFICSSKIARSAGEDVTYPASMFSSISAAVRFLGLAPSVSCCGYTTFVVIADVDFSPVDIELLTAPFAKDVEGEFAIFEADASTGSSRADISNLALYACE